MGKGAIARIQQFLLLPDFFPKDLYCRHIKKRGLFGKGFESKEKFFTPFPRIHYLDSPKVRGFVFFSPKLCGKKKMLVTIVFSFSQSVFKSFNKRFNDKQCLIHKSFLYEKKSYILRLQNWFNIPYQHLLFHLLLLKKGKKLIPTKLQNFQPNYKIWDWSKLKALADDKIKVINKMCLWNTNAPTTTFFSRTVTSIFDLDTWP